MINRFYGWYGGKYRVVMALLACIPDYVTAFYEACAGSAVVTLNMKRRQVEVVSDLDPEVVHLLAVMADRQLGRQLVDKLVHLPYSRDVFLDAMKARAEGYKGLDDVGQAVAIFTLITQSFNNTRKVFRAKGPTRRAYAFAQASNLPWVYERMAGVKVKLMDCADVVAKVKDNPRAMVYLDLPYRHALRARGARATYGHEMTDAEHVAVLEACRDARCCILICGYHDGRGEDLYDKVLDIGQPGSRWNRFMVGRLPKSCQTSLTKGKGEEYIWVNYPVPKAAGYYFNTNKNPANRLWTPTEHGVIIPDTKIKEVAA